MILVYIGQDVSYSGWVASYAVLMNVSTKQVATYYSSIFWMFMTSFKFIFAFIKIKPSYKLKMLIKAQIILTLLILALI